MRISDCSSDVCSSDLPTPARQAMKRWPAVWHRPRCGRDRRQNDRHGDFAPGAGDSFAYRARSALSRSGIVPDCRALDEDVMATVTTEDLRNMTPLRVANHTVGKPDETLAMMEEDGYVYFRDVLDQGAVGRLRQRRSAEHTYELQ